MDLICDSIGLYLDSNRLHDPHNFVNAPPIGNRTGSVAHTATALFLDQFSNGQWQLRRDIVHSSNQTDSVSGFHALGTNLLIFS